MEAEDGFLQELTPDKRTSADRAETKDYFSVFSGRRAMLGGPADDSGGMEGELISRTAFRLAAILAAVVVLGGAASEELQPVLMGLALIIVVAKLGGDAARAFGQPSVLGELMGGIVIGNLSLLGVPIFEALGNEFLLNGMAQIDALADNTHLNTIAQIGVLLLLFEVGLESTVKQMLATGLSSLLVALLGIIAPMALGWFASQALLPEATWHTHLFVAATLTATSVGITARVLKDLGRSRSLESRTILGAAVIDDVLGLVVLSVVLGAVAASADGSTFAPMHGVAILGTATSFLVVAILLGIFVVPRIFSFSARLTSTTGLFATSLGFCFFLSWGAGAFGLAPIIGAFAAGLVLEEIHFRDFSSHGQKELEDLIHPLVSFLAPVFFVMMGMHTDLAEFADVSVLGIAAVLIVAAIVGKQAAALGVVGRNVDRMTVGIGMIPRGEVGLIFASAGQHAQVGGVNVLSNALFSALIIVVLVTTMITPPLLKWSIARAARKQAGVLPLGDDSDPEH